MFMLDFLDAIDRDLQYSCAVANALTLRLVSCPIYPVTRIVLFTANRRLYRTACCAGPLPLSKPTKPKGTGFSYL